MYVKAGVTAQGLFVQCIICILGFALDKMLDVYVKVTLLSLLCYVTFISAVVDMCMPICVLIWAHSSRDHHGGCMREVGVL